MTKLILKEFPDTLETERLLLRCPLPGDGILVYEAMKETREELLPWMAWALEEPDCEQVEINVRKAHIHFLERRDLRFHLFIKENGAFVGSSGLHRLDWKVPCAEIGYWCRKRYMGQGLISEAVRGLRDFGVKQLGMKRLAIHCDRENGASRRVAERAGFTLEGILRQHERATNGELRDTAIYADVVL
ncbi:GNAT family N-acetyltransferase [Marininema halotolerans]|uniref:Protein N-acetyltransferase, RimJ/RimL family n=1 Tax=Marininema halotolerans TaxID=1155944 RepID=A0A1I6NVP8_9BACL|nr:GNAT family protein [Marininema halotolerans]SFS31919.1 Protein N-acetyltransferase, RimJ/RimL family [Marininema halotolerans]